MPPQNISDEYLNAFVDNQLDSSEKIKVFDAIRQNDLLKDRVCELSGLKEMMQHAYKMAPVSQRPTLNQRLSWARRTKALAACMLLLFGGISGWFTHAWSNTEGRHDVKNIFHATQASDITRDTRKIIVHVSSANPMRLKATLDETEGLLEMYRQANQKLEVEVIANKKGINLLRTNISSHEKRITLMQEKYPNLHFLVCGQTINKLQQNGDGVALLPHTEIAPSAAEQISKRLEQGWGYIRI